MIIPISNQSYKSESISVVQNHNVINFSSSRSTLPPLSSLSLSTAMLSLSPHHHLRHHSLPKPFLHSLFSPPPSPLRSLSLHPATSLSTPLCIQSISATAHPEPVNPSQSLPSDHRLKIAVIGFGNFGQFLAKAFVSQGHTVLAHSRSNHSQTAKKLGVSFFQDPHDLCEEHPEVILLCTSILSTEKVLNSLPLQRLKRNTLFVDVLSVKEFAKNLLLDVLPPDFDILCTHPMFGPQSGKRSWKGLNFVYDKVRIGEQESRVSRCEKFLDVFVREGCMMVEMSCSEHDLFAAGSQFMTHTVGRVLGMLELESTPINTKGYEVLLDLVENTFDDSFDLYYGLFMYNKSALESLERLDLGFEALKKELFGSLHDVVRKQLFGNGKRGQRRLQESSGNGIALGVDKVRVSLTLSRSWINLLVKPEVKISRKELFKSHEYKAQASDGTNDSSKLKVAVVGFGNFGQFLAKAIIRQGHIVLAYSRTDYSDVAREMGVSYFSDADDLCEEHPEVILLWSGLERMKEEYQGSQFITHTIGRILEKLGLESTPINTKGYETLLKLVENTAGDSFDLYYGLFMYNVNAMEQLERLDLAFESLKKQLLGRVHGVLRRQLFENAETFTDMREKPTAPKLSQNGTAHESSLETVNAQKN
ncbi:hypothetical protein Pint_13824 [Pistacia integerrima]|uniref:Uncharacterized protein n=1 Tax=Pistacia integerrima TaxID=434235 RepID=A0ACC0Y792_9ROSI|nr:hypothetical protein Pint_13824 [Pistacia integerrima]